MDTTNNLVLELLSAGVIASLVTGLFSLAITIKNNKRLIDLEKNKQNFTITQERFKALREAYDELVNLLPEENLVGYIIMNLPLHNNFQEDSLTSAFDVAENNMKIMYSHFKKYGYLLLEEEQKCVNELVEELDFIAKSLYNAQSDLKVYTVDESLSSSDIKIYATNRIIKVTEFEEVYFNLYKNSLSKMSKMDL